MPWHSIRGHDCVVSQFRRALGRGRLASTFLFVGPAGIGKRTFALKLAEGLLCDRVPEQRLDPCGDCSSCRQVQAVTHPDLHIVAKPPDKSSIPLKLLIGEDETRMQEGLCYDIALKPYSGRRKVALIDDVDYLNKEGANCLLKTLEEPPPQSVLILLGTSEQRQLPTIRSRCQIVRFRPLADKDVAELLIERGLCDDPAIARQAAARSEGSLERAQLWCDSGLIDFRRDLLGILGNQEPKLSDAAKLVGQFVDEAGKESAAKRQRLRLAVALAEEFYRSLLRLCTADQLPADPDLSRATQAAAAWIAGDDAAAACLDVCLSAYDHIDANANHGILIEWWLDELAAAARTGRVAI